MRYSKAVLLRQWFLIKGGRRLHNRRETCRVTTFMVNHREVLEIMGLVTRHVVRAMTSMRRRPEMCVIIITANHQGMPTNTFTATRQEMLVIILMATATAVIRGTTEIIFAILRSTPGLPELMLELAAHNSQRSSFLLSGKHGILTTWRKHLVRWLGGVSVKLQTGTLLGCAQLM